MNKSCRIISLSGGRYVAIVSVEDFRRVNRYSWRVTMSAGTKRRIGKPYARGIVNGKDTYLHRFIMNAPEFMQVDHRNHCTLDCRRSNLEVVDALTNQSRKRKKQARKELSNGYTLTTDRAGDDKAVAIDYSHAYSRENSQDYSKADLIAAAPSHVGEIWDDETGA